MNIHQTRIYITLSATLIACSAGSALSMEPQPSNTNRTQELSAIATRSLVLQPGDASLISRSLSNPVEFIAVAKDREFTSQLLVHAKSGKHLSASARLSQLIVKKSAFVEEYVVDVPNGMSESELASILIATGDYEFVEPNWLRYPAIVPNDPQYNSSWQHTRLESASAWNLNTGSSDVIVAVCDSGVDLDHPDLVASLVPGYNSASNRTQANGGDVDDINGHGTFVAGCAAARGNNNTGVVGVGWNFSVMPIRVTNNTSGTASSFDILEGARWAAENGAKIVNASFSGGTSASNQSTGAYLKTQGALLFWASGNDGSFITPNRPDYVLVGSTTSSDNRSGFSNFGPAVDVTAPGSSVRSTQRGGGYGNGSGTSYASPIAAGVGAMIYSVNPEFSADDVQDILYHSVDDLGATGRDDSFGRGRVNTRKSIENALVYVRPAAGAIAEDFETSSWQDLFVATSGDFEVISPLGAPMGGYVLIMDNTDVVETVPLAGRFLQGNQYLSFTLESASIEPGESIEVQFLENPEVQANTWTTLATINGQGLTNGQAVQYNYLLPNEYKWHGVKLRFKSNGSDATDTWMIDSFTLDTVLTAPVAPLVEHFENATVSFLRWQTNVGTQVGFNDNNFFAQMSDADSIESKAVPLGQFGIVPAFIRFDAWADNQVTSGDTLKVQVLNIVNNWIDAGTISASSLSSSPQLFELNVPITAIAIDTMRVRFISTTTGIINLDNVYVGVEELPSGGCNPADLAEPFGTLNFFDVSAFLSAFNVGDSSADINNDGVYNFFDISGFLTAFNVGCP